MRHWLSPEQINRLAADPAHRARADLPLNIDLRRPFVPERHTQLYFTPLYASLHYEHRLRYNQLFALRINEYIMMLEADLVERLLVPLKGHRRVTGNAALLTAIDTMIVEEQRHFAAFAALNRACRPELYPAGSDRLFSRLPGWTNAMFRIFGRFAFSLWYLMAMEESATALAREMHRRPETETLGTIDPGFVSVHLEHMKDEARHVHIDGLLIDLCIGSGTRVRRAVNARLFQAMLRGITTPTRGGSGVKVIRRLVLEMPELQARESELIDAVLALKNNRGFQESLFNRRIMPMTFQVFDTTAELWRLPERMAGYDRR